jgi:hypothetical protein
MYSKKIDSMTTPLSVHMWHKKTETTALLDSGAMHNFIDKWAVTSLGLGTRTLPHPSKSTMLTVPLTAKEALPTSATSGSAKGIKLSN